MVDFNPAKEAIKAYNSLIAKITDRSQTPIDDGMITKYSNGVSVFQAYRNKEGQSSVIVNFDKDGKHYQLCDHDGDGNFDAITIHSDKGRNIDQYFDDEDDGTFDRHSHSDTKGNHYVEHRAKWYNPMTWFKHNE